MAVARGAGGWQRKGWRLGTLSNRGYKKQLVGGASTVSTDFLGAVWYQEFLIN